jgi:hypothetical protein
MYYGPCKSKLLMLKKIIVIVIAAALALIDDSVQGHAAFKFIHSFFSADFLPALERHATRV